MRTQEWENFPQGKWTLDENQQFSETTFLPFGLGSVEERRGMWGHSLSGEEDVFEVFAKYVEGKISMLPWSEAPLQMETIEISSELAAINRRGFLTINSQPAVNGL